MQAIRFKNFSDESFTHMYDGVPFTFEKGQETMLEDYKAEHFAKHLIDRELNKKGLMTNDKVRRAELEALCLPTTEPVSEQIVEEVITALAPKKKATKVEKKSKEFEELNEK